jgi:hypothetical protein
MRVSSVLAALFVALISAHAVAQTTTTTINVTWTNNNGGCSFFGGQRDIAFQDTAGSNWTYLKIRIPMAVTQTVNGQPATPSQVNVSINGAPVGNAVVVSNDGTFCGNLQVYEFGTAALPGYHAFATNTFSITSNGGYVGGAPAELIFTTEPRKFAFDLVPAMSQKVMLHPDPNDTNLSPWQVVTGSSQKPLFRFHGVVTSNTASPEADVWLRVVDPPDPSPYLPQHSPDDNEDPLRQGVLMPRGCATAACRALPGQPLQVRSSPGGVVDVELEATDRYAGDNYYVEASF